MFPMYPNYNNPYAYKPNNGIQYVNGFESAKAYNLAPNESVILMDSNKSTFYLKQADASGFATVRTYDFVEHKETAPTNDFVSRAEFNEMKTQLYNLSNELKNTVRTPIMSAERVNYESNFISKENAERATVG